MAVIVKIRMDPPPPSQGIFSLMLFILFDLWKVGVYKIIIAKG